VLNLIMRTPSYPVVHCGPRGSKTCRTMVKGGGGRNLCLVQWAFLVKQTSRGACGRIGPWAPRLLNGHVDKNAAQ